MKGDVADKRDRCAVLGIQTTLMPSELSALLPPAPGAAGVSQEHRDRTIASASGGITCDKNNEPSI
jgi:hypothetical protein